MLKTLCTARQLFEGVDAFPIFYDRELSISLSEGRQPKSAGALASAGDTHGPTADLRSIDDAAY